MTTSAAEPWVETILSARRPLKRCGRTSSTVSAMSHWPRPNPQILHRQTVDPDRLLADSAWSLWEGFSTHAPKVIDELKRFWVSRSVSGTAVVILDALSLRELPLIVTAAEKRNITPVRIQVRGSQVPTDTDQFAKALGVPSRSQLHNNRPPGSFIFAGEDTYTDVLHLPFEDCLAAVKPKPRLFLWHSWLDDLLHRYGANDDAHTTVARKAKEQLGADGFWDFIDRIREGRRLVITSDHGYAVSQFFYTEKDEDAVKLLQQQFGAKRCAPEKPDNQWPQRHLPPLAIRHDGSLVVTGQRQWKIQGGFPHLCHRGLSLLEAAVPFIELPAVSRGQGRDLR